MRVIFMGTPDFAVPSLKKIVAAGFQVPLVITQPDRRAGRGKKMKSSKVKGAAQELGLQLYQPETILNVESVDRIKKAQPHVIVVIAYGQLIPKEILELPPYGCINVHASLLPTYRGAAPIHHAVINGEKLTGITIMQMDEGLDTGDIIKQREYPIGENETMGEVHDMLANLGAALLLEVLKELPIGITPESQDSTQATYASKITRSEERIHWTQEAVKIHNMVRGLNPWPGAYTELDGELIKIWETEIFTDTPAGDGQKPGTILKVNSASGIDVQTGEGIIRIKALQASGKKRLQVGTFLAGRLIKVGAHFDG